MWLLGGWVRCQAALRQARKECSIAERELMRETKERLAIEKRCERQQHATTTLPPPLLPSVRLMALLVRSGMRTWRPTARRSRGR